MKVKRFIVSIALATVSGACLLGNLFGVAAKESSGYEIEDSAAIQGGGQTLSVQANQKDPNGDGVISLADAIYIKSFLAGNLYPTDVTRLDYSGNGIVSELDAAMIAKVVLEGMN